METITGSLSKISPSSIKKLFPNISDKSVRMLQRGDSVEVLIGMCKPSWHPERVEKANGGGDFWKWRGKFGSCLGGSHPHIKEETRKSDKLFHVNHSYLIAASPSKSAGQSMPHELENRNRSSSVSTCGSSRY